ncbi:MULTISPECIES: GPW/gp25 family protein [Moraxella]|uniref:Phage baseplate assembly protein n=1 Tax=Moraxella catarrhalis TaxID=480 RepID=A0A7Z1A3K0_MORCA|nr:GPW/gp25 family protein [Moraxella catarrhalis]OAV00225.1 Phage baseplate assembly protein [Moraxella catarrhalis]STY82494.1 Gene 25-like lysozyme [Moraxella catarrhalis]
MISRNNGEKIDYVDQIRQSITDILTTPIGSRVMRREYGSLLPELIDQPFNDAVILMCYSAIYSALHDWEDRIVIEQVGIERMSHGQVVVNIDASFSDSGEAVTLSVDLGR